MEICGFGMDVRLQEAVFQADQDVQKRQLFHEGVDGELDSGVEGADLVEEHIPFFRGPRP